jgi:hypothetical protein
MKPALRFSFARVLSVATAVIGGTATLVLPVSAIRAQRAGTGPAAPPRVQIGGRVGWARLVTPSEHWRRHANYDGMLSKFIRTETTLNMDPQWQSADPADLDRLCSYPVIFTNKLTDVTAPDDLGHLREYVQRGGFLIVDSCTNPDVTRDPDEFVTEHTALFRSLVPSARVEMLPVSHAIYQSYFSMRETPPHSFMNRIPDPKWAKHGLYGVFDARRMIALLSLSGLQCGWAQTGPVGHDLESMRMLVNIYVYAMTRAEDSAKAP